MFFTENVPFPFKGKNRAKAKIKELAKCENKKIGNICFIFCNDEYLLNINSKYLNHNYYTDIITFDYTEDDILGGDIYISADRVAENAKTFQTDFEHELSRVIYHGILHLCGYKDKSPDEQQVMKAKEDKYLEVLSVINKQTDCNHD
jgi:rRNA maturation RNase YbeY